MKKVLLLALAVVFCFMLVGCGEKDNTNNGGEVNPPIINSGNVKEKPALLCDSSGYNVISNNKLIDSGIYGNGISVQNSDATIENNILSTKPLLFPKRNKGILDIQYAINVIVVFFLFGIVDKNAVIENGNIAAIFLNTNGNFCTPLV